MLARSMPSKRAASRDFYAPYSMFSSDEKWVLMHTGAAGGEKRAWLPIKAVCGYETIAFGSWKNWTSLTLTYIQINQMKIQGEILVQTFKYLTYLTDVLALEL